jgi:hypothetical protein
MEQFVLEVVFPVFLVLPSVDCMQLSSSGLPKSYMSLSLSASRTGERIPSSEDWKIYESELLLLYGPCNAFSGSFTQIRRNDMSQKNEVLFFNQHSLPSFSSVVRFHVNVCRRFRYHALILSISDVTGNNT